LYHRRLVPGDDARRDRRHQFGERLRQMRAERGLTQEQLAHDAGLDRKTVNRIENGAYSPALDRIFLIADALGEPVGVLFEGL
jgi:transcriptional regulator with XRE-family HTH domain